MSESVTICSAIRTCIFIEGAPDRRCVHKHPHTRSTPLHRCNKSGCQYAKEDTTGSNITSPTVRCVPISTIKDDVLSHRLLLEEVLSGE